METSFNEFLQRKNYPDTMSFLKCTTSVLQCIGLDENTFVEHHTLIPFYRLFVPYSKYSKLSVGELCEEPYRFCFLLPKVQGLLKENNQYLWYCPICHSFERNYSDIQSCHQIADVHVCALHHCFLKKIPLKSKKILSVPELWDVSFEMCEDEWFIGIAEDAAYILDAKPNVFVEEFSERIWKFVETEVFENKFRSWKEVSDLLEKLPTEYKKCFANFRLNKYLTNIYNPKISTLEYLVLIRAIFGSFKQYVEFSERNIFDVA